MQNLNNFLASVHYLNHPLLSGLSALSILLMGIFVLSKNSKSGLYRTFFGITFILSVWFFGNALSMFYYDNFERAIFWLKFGYTPVPFLAVSYYIFYLAYSDKKQNKIIYPLYIICLLEIFYLWFFGDIRSGAYVLSNVGIVWRGMPAFSYFLIFGMVKYIIVSAITFISFLGEYKKETGFQKKRVKWLVIAFFVLIFGSIEWLVAFNIPLHIAWVLVPAFIGIIAYAILKYRLMDINIIIKKALVYSVGITLVSGLIISISLLSSWFASKIPGFSFWTVPFIAGAGAFIIGRLFWRKSKEVDKLKYEFITVAAHKLRTPLTEVKWGLDTARDRNISEEERLKLIEKIFVSNERLIEITNDILNISKTEDKNYAYKMKAIDLKEVTDSILKNFESETKKKNIKLITHFEKDLPKVLADKTRIISVIQILIENAILYTKNKIDIIIDSHEENIFFHIEDNGIGIPKEEQEYVFSSFYRSHGAYLSDTEGIGLGLHLAKNIIKRHGGKIGVKSEGKNKGSIFWFELKML